MFNYYYCFFLCVPLFSFFRSSSSSSSLFIRILGFGLLNSRVVCFFHTLFNNICFVLHEQDVDQSSWNQQER